MAAVRQRGAYAASAEAVDVAVKDLLRTFLGRIAPLQFDVPNKRWEADE